MPEVKSISQGAPLSRYNAVKPELGRPLHDMVDNKPLNLSGASKFSIVDKQSPEATRKSLVQKIVEFFKNISSTMDQIVLRFVATIRHNIPDSMRNPSPLLHQDENDVSRSKVSQGFEAAGSSSERETRLPDVVETKENIRNIRNIRKLKSNALKLVNATTDQDEVDFAMKAKQAYDFIKPIKNLATGALYRCEYHDALEIARRAIEQSPLVASDMRFRSKPSASECSDISDFWNPPEKTPSVVNQRTQGCTAASGIEGGVAQNTHEADEKLKPVVPEPLGSGNGQTSHKFCEKGKRRFFRPSKDSFESRNLVELQALREAKTQREQDKEFHDITMEIYFENQTPRRVAS